MQKLIKLWHNDNDFYYDDEIVEWYDDYKQCKVQKSRTKKELVPIAWHPSRCYNWGMPMDEKKETEKLRNYKSGESAQGVNAAWWILDSYIWLSNMSTQKNHMTGSKIYN